MCFFGRVGLARADSRMAKIFLADLRQLETVFPGRVCFGSDSPFYSFNLIPSEQKWLDTAASVLSGRWTRLDDLLAYAVGTTAAVP
jgi:hypothetical protein